MMPCQEKETQNESEKMGGWFDQTVRQRSYVSITRGEKQCDSSLPIKQQPAAGGASKQHEKSVSKLSEACDIRPV